MKKEIYYKLINGEYIQVGHIPTERTLTFQYPVGRLIEIEHYRTPEGDYMILKEKNIQEVEK